jgi:hypothetical protein
MLILDLERGFKGLINHFKMTEKEDMLIFHFEQSFDLIIMLMMKKVVKENFEN